MDTGVAVSVRVNNSCDTLSRTLENVTMFLQCCDIKEPNNFFFDSSWRDEATGYIYEKEYG